MWPFIPGENFPYTNYHNLNQDWIIGVVKDFYKDFNNIEAALQSAIAEMNQGKTEMEAQFSGDLQNMLNTFTNAANQTINNLLDTIPADYSELSENVAANNNELQAIIKSAHANFNLPYNAFYAKTGDIIRIKVNSINGRITIFTVNYPNDSLQITDTGSYTYIVLHDGYIRIYPSENNSLYSDIDISILTNTQKLAENNFYNLHPYRIVSKNTFTSDLYVKPGDKLKITVKQVTGTFSTFVVNHSEHATVADRPGDWYFTAQHEGFIRFYLGDNLNETDIVDVYVLSEINNIPVTPLLNKYIKVSQLYPTIIKNAVNYADINSNANINNYYDFARVSSVAKTSEPIKIRDEAGQLIYNFDITNRSEITSQFDAYAYFAFDKYGNYLRYYGYSDIPENTFDDDMYYVIFVDYPGNESYSKFKWYIKPVHIDWLNQNEIYHVGVGYEFTTFTGALEALKNNTNQKTIIVHPGTYNIFNEIGGADYINTIYQNAAHMNWRDVCSIVPPNTKIIGIGKVVLLWNPTAEQIRNADTAFLFSPLNLSGSAEIENITVECTNGRYAIHDECSGQAQYDNIVRKFKNVIAINHGGTYTNGFAYGSGHGKFSKYEFENCKFITEASASAFSSHDWQQSDAANISEYNINNCIFKSPTGWSGMRVSTSDTVGKNDAVRINNSHISKGIAFSSEDASTPYRQGYDITTLNCNQLEITVANNISITSQPEQYNTI